MTGYAYAYMNEGLQSMAADADADADADASDAVDGNGNGDEDGKGKDEDRTETLMDDLTPLFPGDSGNEPEREENLLPLFRSSFLLNIGGRDMSRSEQQGRTHYFVSAFPSTFDTSDLKRMFLKYSEDVYVRWIDSTSAVISLPEQNLNNGLDLEEYSSVSIVPYHSFVRQQVLDYMNERENGNPAKKLRTE